MSDPTDDLRRLLDDRVDAATPRTAPSWGSLLDRRRQRRNRRTTMAVAAASTLVVTGIATALWVGRPDPAPMAGDRNRVSDSPPVTATSQPVDQASITAVAPGAKPPDPVLLIDDKQTPVSVTSTCWSHSGANFCSDGFAMPPYTSAGRRAVVPFGFPIEGWSFTASAQPLPPGGGEPDTCSRFIDVPVVQTGSLTFEARPAGPTGRYLVHLVGEGPQGSVSASFAWTTTTAGAFPEPTGYAGVLSGAADELTSYGVEVGLTDLDRAYPAARATVTVTAADGASATYGPFLQRESCGDGRVFISSPPEAAQGAASLGPGPFAYRVEVELGSRTYVGTALWPRDERRDEAPYADLVFDPPLPAYTDD